MRFSWIALIVAPLLVPLLFSVTMVSFSESGNPLVMFLFLMIAGCVISYGTTVFLFLPTLYLLSRWRPLTGLNVCLHGPRAGHAGVRAADMDRLEEQRRGFGPPTESFPAFFLRWAADPFNAIYPVAGLMTAGFYWWLVTSRRGGARQAASPTR